jgi:group II intron reverse transcriptase/maturase
VLNAVYEADFLGFSHGFRPQRNPHSALAALDKALMTQRVNFVLDVDIRAFFDSVDHGWLMRMLAHRIADPRVLRLINRWLAAGVLESGQWRAVEAGTPQGSGISPILANVFLHYVVDLWVHQWRGRRAVGQVIVCRYADDMALGCEFEADGKQLLAELKDRLEQFGLSLHEGKTRLIEFGRFAARNRAAAAGRRRPETFDFLGFTHYCGKTRTNKFVVKRKTQAKRLVRKLKTIRDEMQRRMHAPVREQHRWLRQVLNGHYQYFGVIFNYRSLRVFKECVVRLWRKALGKRSQKGRMTWATYRKLLLAFPLPEPAIHQAWRQ